MSVNIWNRRWHPKINCGHRSTLIRVIENVHILFHFANECLVLLLFRPRTYPQWVTLLKLTCCFVVQTKDLPPVGHITEAHVLFCCCSDQGPTPSRSHYWGSRVVLLLFRPRTYPSGSHYWGSRVVLLLFRPRTYPQCVTLLRLTGCFVVVQTKDLPQSVTLLRPTGCFVVVQTKDLPPVGHITEAHVLLHLGDSVTTDHISPAGSIARNSPAARYLSSRG